MDYNTLKRYEAIVECYNTHKTEDIPTTRVYKKHIYPRFFISRQTLYAALNTPIQKKLKEIEATRQLSLPL